MLERLRFSIRLGLAHLLISVLVASCAAGLVFWFWYPQPWGQMLGVGDVFWIIVAVDVVCGPLLTLVLASPRKPRSELRRDLMVVGILQLAALCYGLWTVYSVRPVVVVFDVDRFMVVSASEVEVGRLLEAPEGLKSLPFSGVRLISVRDAKHNTEFEQSIELAVAGQPKPFRPHWWISYDEMKAKALHRSRPLNELTRARPESRPLLENAGLTDPALRFLPLTSSRRTDWIAVLGSDGSVMGYLPVDGFIERSNSSELPKSEGRGS